MYKYPLKKEETSPISQAKNHRKYVCLPERKTVRLTVIRIYFFPNVLFVSHCAEYQKFTKFAGIETLWKCTEM